MAETGDISRGRAVAFVVIQTLVWFAMTLIMRPYLDTFGDTVEVYAWSQHLLMGSNKHPQLLPWFAHFWFRLMPRSVASFYGLGALLLLIGYLGMLALGRECLGSRRKALAGVALAGLSVPYLVLSYKVNMNAILLALWPWLTLAFLRAVALAGTPRSYAAALAFGFLAAASVLGKYFSGVLMVSVLLITLTPARRRIWRTGMPWIGIAVFAILMVPHIRWELRHHMETLGYVDNLANAKEMVGRLVAFALTPVTFWLVPWAIALWLFYDGGFLTRLRQSLRRQGEADVLWYLSVLPLAISIAIGAAGLVRMSELWAIPIGFAYPFLWLRNATRAPELVETSLLRLLEAFRWVFPGLIGVGVATALVAALTGNHDYYYPERAAAAAVMAQWHKIAPGMPLAWAAGGNNAARLAYFAVSDPPVEALPTMPDVLPDYYPERERWQQDGGVVICPLGEGSVLSVETDCTRSVQQWSKTMQFPLEPFRFTVERLGLRFPRMQPYSFAAFYYRPKGAKP